MDIIYSKLWTGKSVSFQTLWVSGNNTDGIRFLILNQETVRLGNTQYKKLYNKFDKSKHILYDKDLIKNIEKIYSTNIKKFYRIKGILSEVLEVKNDDGKPYTNDENLLQVIARYFDRPAFTTPFFMESNLPDFKKAINDTIEAVNTGVYRLRDGNIIDKFHSKHYVKNPEIKGVLDIIVKELIKLRHLYDNLVSKGEIEILGHENSGVHMISESACKSMDDQRKKILKLFKNIYPNFGVNLCNIPDFEN